MKPLSELVKQFRESRARTYASENADHYRGFDAGQLRAAESLQAWLREAEIWVANNRYQAVKLLGDPANFAGEVNAEDVLCDLLGTTTRQEDGK